MCIYGRWDLLHLCLTFQSVFCLSVVTRGDIFLLFKMCCTILIFGLVWRPWLFFFSSFHQNSFNSGMKHIQYMHLQHPIMLFKNSFDHYLFMFSSFTDIVHNSEQQNHVSLCLLKSELSVWSFVSVTFVFTPWTWFFRETKLRLWQLSSLLLWETTQAVQTT